MLIKLHLMLCLMAIFYAILMNMTRNPVESTLFLIMSFCVAAVQLFIFNAEFVGLSFIIIYVGAIAVLFLFVVMMINIKEKIRRRVLLPIEYYFQLFVYGVMFVIIFWLTPKIYTEGFIDPSKDPVSLDNSINSISMYDLFNIEVMGQFLYNYAMPLVLLAGLILLVALIGAIVLTLRFKKFDQSQLVNKQLSRTENFISFFKDIRNKFKK